MKQEQLAIIIHPGEVLREDFLLPLKLTPEKLAKSIKVSPKVVKELITEKRKEIIPLQVNKQPAVV